MPCSSQEAVMSTEEQIPTNEWTALVLPDMFCLRQYPSTCPIPPEGNPAMAKKFLRKRCSREICCFTAAEAESITQLCISEMERWFMLLQRRRESKPLHMITGNRLRLSACCLRTAGFLMSVKNLAAVLIQTVIPLEASEHGQIGEKVLKMSKLVDEIRKYAIIHL